MDALQLLSGDAQTFVEKVWASRVHVHETDPEDLVALLSFEDVDALLTSTAIRTPAVRLAKNGTVLPQSTYTRRGASLAGQSLTGLVDARRLTDLFEDGATVVLQGLHRYHSPLTRLVSELEAALGHPCQANAYLTPPGSQGFAVHSDSHDVFVFQTHGRKLWEVHPAPGDRGPGWEEPREVQLRPGLAMYLPTGTPHAARAQDDVSLHVTIGINQLTWGSLLQKAVASAMTGVEADTHLPAAYADRPEVLAEGLAERLRRLAERIAATDVDRAVGDLLDSFLQQRAPSMRGSLTDRMRVGEIDGSTRLRRRPGRPCVLRAEEDRLHVLLGDRRVSVPARVTAAVEALRDATELTPADLPIDGASAVVLCRRFVREGLLEVVP